MREEKKVQIVEVDSEQNGQRLDNFLIKILKGVPKSRIYRALRSGEVRVNKGRAKADTRIETGDQIRIPPIRQAEAQLEKKLPDKLAQTMVNAIIDENSDFILINKPSGIPVHGGSGFHWGVVEIFRQLRPKAKLIDLAHRLDRDTSGCLLLAKKSSVLKTFHQAFYKHEVHKSYLAWVLGNWQLGEKSLEQNLSIRLNQDNERRVHVSDEGQVAMTKFIPLVCYPNFSLIKALPKTGRMHQIRVQLASLNHPIMGDSKYGDYKINHLLDRHLGINHTLLHSASLEFQFNDHWQRYCAVLPEVFKQITTKAETINELLLKMS